MASHFHSLFPDFELYLLPEARHFPQLDESEEVAQLILSAPVQGIGSAVAQTDASVSVDKVRIPVLPPGGRDARGGQVRKLRSFKKRTKAIYCNRTATGLVQVSTQ